jgi:Ran GTPase-activating protein (RanGAP) involved in mRNA processing and transport
MFSTIIEFVLCLKFEFNTLQLLSLTSKDVKDEIDKMLIPVRFRFNKVIKKMGFDIPLTITTRFKITSLDFAMSNISEEYFTKLLQLISLCDALTNLNLRNNQIGSKWAKKLATVLLTNRQTLEPPSETVLLTNRQTLESPLETVETVHTPLVILESPIVTVQKQCKLLTNLDLKNNKIGPEGIESLAAVLWECNCLTSLDLSENELGDTGIKCLEQLQSQVLEQQLYHHTSLTILNLSENQISPLGIESFVQVLKKWGSLSHLNLSYNNIGPEGTENLAQVLVSPQCVSLSHLNLSYNNIGFLGVKKLANVLPQCSSLTLLDLSINRIGPNGAEELATVLPQCKVLSHIFLDGNYIGKAGIKNLERAISQCTTLTYFYIKDY